MNRLKGIQFVVAASLGVLGIQCAGPVEAALIFNVFESGPDLVVSASGSLSLSTIEGAAQSFWSGRLESANANIATGSNINLNTYQVSGPLSFGGSVSLVGASSVSGTPLFLQGDLSRFSIDPSYASGSQIVSTATFSNKTLLGAGFPASGFLATWSLGTGETISLEVAPSPPPAVPGPVPLFGAGAAFGLSRRLRHRLNGI